MLAKDIDKVESILLLIYCHSFAAKLQLLKPIYFTDVYQILQKLTILAERCWIINHRSLLRSLHLSNYFYSGPK